ncbi:MAG: hypothetical protein R3C68_14970 [Myxococcota bacterium]
MAAVLRVPSFNELEGLLADGRFQRLLGERGAKRYGKKLFSADVIVDVVDTIELRVLHAAMVELVKKAHANKVFREDTYGSFITVALDGWSPLYLQTPLRGVFDAHNYPQEEGMKRE